MASSSFVAWIQQPSGGSILTENYLNYSQGSFQKKLTFLMASHVPVLKIDAHGAHVWRKKKSSEDQKAG